MAMSKTSESLMLERIEHRIDNATEFTPEMLPYLPPEEVVKHYDDYPVAGVLYAYGLLTDEQKQDAAERCPEALLETQIHTISPELRARAIQNAPIFAATQVCAYLTKEECARIVDYILERKLYTLVNIPVLCATLLTVLKVRGKKRKKAEEAIKIATNNLKAFLVSNHEIMIPSILSYLVGAHSRGNARLAYKFYTTLDLDEEQIPANLQCAPVTQSYLLEPYIPRGYTVAEYRYTLPPLFNPAVLNLKIKSLLHLQNKDLTESLVPALDLFYRAPFAVDPSVVLSLGERLLLTAFYHKFKQFARHMLSDEKIHSLDSRYVVKAVDDVFTRS